MVGSERLRRAGEIAQAPRTRTGGLKKLAISVNGKAEGGSCRSRLICLPHSFSDLRNRLKAGTGVATGFHQEGHHQTAALGPVAMSSLGLLRNAALTRSGKPLYSQSFLAPDACR